MPAGVPAGSVKMRSCPLPLAVKDPALVTAPKVSPASSVSVSTTSSVVADPVTIAVSV